MAGPAWDCCTVYLDDVLVIGKTFKDHLANLREIFEHLHLAGLKLRAIANATRTTHDLQM